MVTGSSSPSDDDARIARLTVLVGQLTDVVTSLQAELNASQRPAVSQPSSVVPSKRVRRFIPFALEDLGLVSPRDSRPVLVQMSSGNEAIYPGRILRVASETLAYAILEDGRRLPLTIDSISAATPLAAFDSTLVDTAIRVTWDREKEQVLKFELGTGSFGGAIP